MKNCESCGYPMEEEKDYSKSDINSKYCMHCAPDGELKTKEEIKEGWINALMEQGSIPLEKASQIVDELMNHMQAWKSDNS